MKVALIGPAHPLRGGIANFNEAFAKALQAEGHHVTLYSFSLQYPSFLFPGTTQFDNGQAPKDLNIVTCINSINPFSWLNTARKINKGNYDLVVVRFWLPFMGPALGSICRLLNSKTKIIAITDNVIPHEKKFGDKPFTKYFVKSCHGFVAMSNSVLEDLSTFTKNQNKIFLPHPIYNIFGDAVNKEDARKRLGINTQDKIILFFGFIRKYKGLQLLLEALAKENCKKNHLKLLIAGEFYEDESVYLEMIKNLKLEDSVILKTTYIPSEEVKYYFSAADICAQTYITATQSGVTQIAYHFDVPMLVTNVGGLSEIVPHGEVGYVCNKNPYEISRFLCDFFENGRAPKFIENIKQQKKRFEWKSFVEGVLSLSKSIKIN